MLIVCSVKDAEASVTEFMETKPIMSDIDARLNYYVVNSVMITVLYK